MNQSIAGSQIMFSNGQTGFLTPNGTILLSNQIQMQPMNQQQILIPGGISNQLTNANSANSLGAAQSMQLATMQANHSASANAVKTGSTQTLIIPASGAQGTSAGQIKYQPIIQQTSAPQFLQIQTANGPMLVALQPPAGPGTASNADSAPTILQTISTGTGQQLQIIPSNPQDTLFSTGNGANQLFLTSNSLASYSSAPHTSITTTLSSQSGNIMSSGPFLTGTTTTNVVNSAVKTRAPRKKALSKHNFKTFVVHKLIDF
jgi:hypothetical protein